jgi:ABC-type polysaccharide/polyol phosphate export permease
LGLVLIRPLTAMEKRKFYYDSAARTTPILAEIREIFQYHDLLALLVANSLKTRYKRSVLGVFWTLLNPLLTMTVLTVAFSTVFRFAIQSYPIYLLTGLIFWNFFANATLGGVNATIVGGGLLRRIYLPRSIFSAAALGSELMNMLLTLLPLLLLMIILGHPITPAILFLPVAVLITCMFTLGIALLISTIGVFFNDWIHIYQVLIMAWFYITPIIYPAEIIPPHLAFFVQWNPMAYLVTLFRDPIYLGRIPGSATLLLSGGLALISFVTGWWVFARKAKQFAYLL